MRTISFSGAIDHPAELISFARNAVREYGFTLNKKKTAVLRRGARQIVTGLVVNKRPNVSREQRRLFRQQVYFVRKFGLDGHLNRTHEFRKNYLDHLLGVGQFILTVNRDDAQLKKDLSYLRELKTAYLSNS